jgi:putative tryptophan/tyrosine transport system substrate-binding protein
MCGWETMRRREFITFIGAVVGFPVAARAQEKGRVYRLGIYAGDGRNVPHYRVLIDELRRHGFVEGQNLVIEVRGENPPSLEWYVQQASALVEARPDVIVMGGDISIRAAQEATKSIPIVALTDDMVAAGFAKSIANPERTTGISLLGTELDDKRQELLLEAVPGVRRLAALADIYTREPHIQSLKEAARARGVDLLTYRVTTPKEIMSAIDAASSSGATALNLLSTPVLFLYRQIILERVASLRLPTMHHWPETVEEEGGFIGYGPRFLQLWRDILARQCIKLLQGVKVADIPIEQPTKFELAINLKTAKALGLSVPESFLVRADKIVE